MSIWRIWKDADNSSDDFRQHSRNACLSIEPSNKFWKSQEASAEVKRLKCLGRALVEDSADSNMVKYGPCIAKAVQLDIQMPNQK